jgi:stage V sporulation protein B
MNLSLPLLSTKIINNIAYFFEPIVLTNVLLKKGYLNSFIVTEYGAYNAYAIATLAIPSFFITAIDSSLLPELIKEKNNQFVFKKRCKQALIITLVIGLTSSLIITIFRDYILMFLYHNTSGSYYIKILGPFFTLFYFEGLLSTILQAKGYLKSILLITIISSISKVLFTIALCFIFNGLNGLIYSEIINIMIVIVLSSYIILKKKKNLKYQKKMKRCI